jgi:biopolymer transport protein ExbD
MEQGEAGRSCFPPEKIIQIAGYPGVTYQDVVSAMDVAKSAGMRVVGILPSDQYLPR